MDCHICVCSPEVLEHFKEEFDYQAHMLSSSVAMTPPHAANHPMVSPMLCVCWQNIREDFLKGVLQDLMEDNLHDYKAGQPRWPQHAVLMQSGCGDVGKEYGADP